MKLLKRIAPLAIVLLSFMVFALIIAKHESHLAQGYTIYAKLAPVDPRSLIQGDYMQLGYELGLPSSDDNADKQRATAYVSTDTHGVIVSSAWQADASHDRALQLKDGQWQWHPATDSFMFAEGLADCYGQAKFAKLSVTEDGQAMLVDLVGEDLGELGCR